MSEIKIKLSKNTADVLEKIFNINDPKILAETINIDIDDFKIFLEEENIEIDKELKKFINELEQEDNYITEVAVASAGFSTGRLTQTEIINQLAQMAGIKKPEAKEFFNYLAELAANEIKKNGEFTLPGFGKLIKTSRKSREGRNPATGKLIKIPTKTTIKFRIGKAMKDAVKG